MRDINTIQARNAAIKGGLGDAVKKARLREAGNAITRLGGRTPDPRQIKRKNIISKALEMVTKPARDYRGFGLRDVQTGLKTMGKQMRGY